MPSVTAALNAANKLREFLLQGKLVGLMGDRPVSSSHELRLYFNKLALFDTTPYRLALSCDAPVYFIFEVKMNKTDYKVFIYSFNSLNPLNHKNELINDMLSQYIMHLEKFVKLYPEQWFNFFPFWSSYHEEVPDSFCRNDAQSE